jgi:hypothetical protein
MSFNTSTGAFSGTPSTVAGATTYIITATNATGSTTQTFTFTVSLAAQATLSITSLTTNTKAYPFTQALSIATSGGSGTGATTFAIASGGTASGCTLSDSTATATITATTVGTCLIQASRTADSTYSAAISLTATFTFTAATQAITFATPSAMTVGGSTQSVVPSASSSLTVTLTSTTTSVCTVADFVIVAVASGTCSITASQVGNANFLAATSAIQTFAISGPATAAAITTQPTGAGNGSVLGTQPVIRIVDSGGNTVTTSSVNVVASIASGTGTLSGTTTVAASSGIATFTNLVVTGTAGAFTLTFTPTSLTAATSNSLTITAGPASKVAITRASVGTERRTAFTTQPQITIRDASNNTVTSSTEVVTATITSGAGGSFVGTTTATASSGLATFTGLGVDGTIGTAYTITYTVTGLTVATATVTLTGTTCYGIFTCQVGDTGSGGGKIFYVASGTFTQDGATGSMCITNCKYLEAAPTTGVNAWTDAAYVWSGNTTQAIGATARGTAIGTGYANTLAIVGQISGGDTSNRAGTISRAYRGPNNQSDWYLPSESEILELYSKRTIVGASWSGSHWTSSETTTDPVRARAHGSGMYSPEKKDALLVRPIRAFALPTTIATAAIAGVTAPVTSATPVTTTTAGTGYTGTVSWTSSGGALVGNFAGATAYTATITLTPTTGYTVTGVNANFFTVAGAATVTHSANSGVITAVFPQTNTTIATAAIAGVTAPVTDASPVATTTAGTGYTGTVSWSGSPSTFASATTYTATITLTPTSGYTLTGVTANFFTVAGAATVTHSANSGVVTAVFSRTLGYCDGSSFTCQVGDTGPGGGKVFYVSASGFSCGPTFSPTGYGGGKCYYLEAAPSTWSGGAGDPRISWSTGANQTVAVPADARETAIGSGYKNSLAIVAQSGNVAETSAAVAAREYTGGSRTDWYLPSKDELNELFINRVAAGATDGYWSSSEATAAGAWDQGFSNGGQGVADPGKQQTTPVRPIRAFGPPTTIATAAIAGVTAPVAGATPVATTTSGTGYTGTVSWSGALTDGKFVSSTTYTATITLTPTSGYTLTGVTANFFTVAGATSVTHSANSGAITAVFPQTNTTIATAAIAGVTAPVTGATPVATTTAGTGYTGTVSWSGSPSTFASATSYTATITLTATAGYTLTGVSENFFTVAGAATVTHSANSGVITAVFYMVGSTGPGGGKIFYAANTPFNCGASSVGSINTPKATTTCLYLEVAPSNWNGGPDPTKPWAVASNKGTSVPDIVDDASAYNNSLGIGRGLQNSLYIVAQGNDTTTAAGAARGYTVGSITDWYLPTTAELNLLCQWANGNAPSVTTRCTGGSLNSSTYGAASAGFQELWYWSSSERDAYEYGVNFAWMQHFNLGVQTSTPKDSTPLVRPVRAF